MFFLKSSEAGQPRNGGGEVAIPPHMCIRVFRLCDPCPRPRKLQRSTTWSCLVDVHACMDPQILANCSVHVTNMGRLVVQ